MQPLKQLELAKRLFPMVALVPAAAARTAALGHIWGALVALDMAARKAQRLGGKAVAAPDLRASLTDPYLVDVISAPDSGLHVDAHPFPHYFSCLEAKFIAQDAVHCDHIESGAWECVNFQCWLVTSQVYQHSRILTCQFESMGRHRSQAGLFGF